MLYIRFPLSLRYVEDLFHERGVDISHETVWFWWNRFGLMIAEDIMRKRWTKPISLELAMVAGRSFCEDQPVAVLSLACCLSWGCSPRKIHKQTTWSQRRNEVCPKIYETARKAQLYCNWQAAILPHSDDYNRKCWPPTNRPFGQQRGWRLLSTVPTTRKGDAQI